MKKGGIASRLLVAAWGIPLLLGTTYLGGWWFAGLIALISFFALFEFYQLQYAKGINPLRGIGFFTSLLILVSWISNWEILGWLIAISLILHLLFGITTNRSVIDVMSGFLGVCYIPLLAGSFIVIREIGFSGDELAFHRGRYLCFAIWGAIWICDTAAYAGGSLMGKNLLAPSISPKKTIEGSIWGFIGAVLFGLVWAYAGLISYSEGIVIGLAAGIFGQMGDLVESKLKREASVKDSGNLLPGHGGILDRFDSMLFTAPIVALYLILA